MKHVCAWCDTELETSQWSQDEDTVTHGICERCLALLEHGQYRSFRISVEGQPTNPVLVVQGDLGRENIGQLLSALRATIDGSRIVLNLSEVGYVDSAGIAAFYELIDRVDGAREIELTGVSSNLYRIFEISGLTSRPEVRITPQGKVAARVLPVPSARSSGTGEVRPRRTTFPGRLDQLERIRHFAERVALDAHLDGERTFNLQVAVSEASANAIEHGLPSGDLSVSASCEDGRLTVVVAHPGSFRTRVTQDPSRSHRGMGLPLMLALVDEVAVSHPPGAGTKVFLSLYVD
jgi:anti-anti-sigma factor